RQRLVAMARDDPASPLAGLAAEGIVIEDGRLQSSAEPRRGETAASLIARHGGQPVQAEADSRPGPQEQQFSMHSFGAVYAEVRVDPDLGIVRVPRIVGAYGVGNVMNEKTARSQLVGGIVWGVSMALFEESLLDPRTGRIVNANLAEYHVPVNAD